MNPVVRSNLIFRSTIALIYVVLCVMGWVFDLEFWKGFATAGVMIWVPVALVTWKRR
jgi:hypothetical protein